MDVKIILTVISTAIGVVSFFPYLRDTFSLKTKPHAYTWLIWAITQGTAVFGIWHGGGGWGALNLTIGTLFVIVVFLFSIKYGTKNITKSDTAILVAALLAIIIWWRLDQPLISVIMVSMIDVIGYIPSFRKSYQEPWSETLISWILFSASNIFDAENKIQEIKVSLHGSWYDFLKLGIYPITSIMETIITEMSG